MIHRLIAIVYLCLSFIYAINVILPYGPDAEHDDPNAPVYHTYKYMTVAVCYFILFILYLMFDFNYE